MISRQAVALSTAALAVAALAGCSSSAKTGAAAATGTATPAASSAAAQSGTNAGLSQAAVAAALQKAAASATAVHVSGSATSGGTSISLDIQLNKTPASASGTINAGGTAVPFVSVGGVTYIQFTASVLKLSGADSDPAASALLKDKWVSSKSSVGSSIATDFQDFTSYSTFTTGMTSTGSNGMLNGATAAGTTSYHGQNVAVYKGSDGTMAYITASGPAYLVALVNASTSEAGTLSFTWNQPMTVNAPPAAQTYNG